MCSIVASAQNIEHQIVASQYGSYQVPTVGQGYSFPPASCQIAGGGKNFPAFKQSVPVKIVDSDPTHTEIATPVAVNVNNNNCSVSMSTTYNHISFYLTSGTGGLQEALNAGQVTGGANTVILDQQWYSLVTPGNPATVIASVQGTTTLGLVDVTTSPYTYYSWGGSAYSQTTPGGGSPTGNAGGTLAGTYPNPSLGTVNVSQIAGAAPIASPTFTGTPLAPTKPISDNNTEIATTQAVTAAGYAPLASPGFSGTPTAPTKPLADNNTEIATSSAVTSALLSYAPLANAPLTGIPTAPTAANGTNTTQIATTAFVLANSSSGGITPSTQYKIPQYSAGGATVGGTSIFTDSTGNNLNIPSGALILTNAGVFSNTASNFPNTTTVNGCNLNTIFQIPQFTAFLTAGTSACITGPTNNPGSAYNQSTGGFFAATTPGLGSGTGTPRAVGVSAYAILQSGSSNSEAYGDNPLVEDFNDSATGQSLIGQEIDVQPQKAASHYGNNGFNVLGTHYSLYNQAGQGGTYGPVLDISGSNFGTAAYWGEAIDVMPGALCINGSCPVLNVNPFQATANSSTNYGGNSLAFQYESIWNGSAGISQSWRGPQAVVGSGTNASDKLVLTHVGNLSGQTHTYELAGGIQIQIDGSTSGNAVLSTTATGGTLNLGSTNATIDQSGNLIVNNCTGCGGTGTAVFPSTPGVVWNTSTSAARNSTPSDMLTLVGYYTGAYSSGTTYKFNDIAADGSGNNYISLSAGNVGNALTNTTFWHFLGGVSSTIVGGNCGNAINMVGISTTGVPVCTSPFTITASATPVISMANGPLQTITLTSATAPTVTGIAGGSRLAIQICQGSTVYAWTWPAAIHGGICVGPSCTPYPSQPNTCSMQTFNSFNGSTLVPENIGVVNIAP